MGTGEQRRIDGLSVLAACNFPSRNQPLHRVRPVKDDRPAE